MLDIFVSGFQLCVRVPLEDTKLKVGDMGYNLLEMLVCFTVFEKAVLWYNIKKMQKYMSSKGYLTIVESLGTAVLYEMLCNACGNINRGSSLHCDGTDQKTKALACLDAVYCSKFVSFKNCSYLCAFWERYKDNSCM